MKRTVPFLLSVLCLFLFSCAPSGITEPPDTDETPPISEEQTPSPEPPDTGNVQTAKTYTVYLDAKGGKLSVTLITVTYGEPPNLPTPTETESAKGFLGWYYGNTPIGATSPWTIEKDGVTLTAIWSENPSWSGEYS